MGDLDSLEKALLELREDILHDDVDMPVCIAEGTALALFACGDARANMCLLRC